ncbi:MAG: fibro-slime domain-containing protein, partial [Chitinivibrionales bacterium]
MVEIGKKVCIASILFIAVAAGVSSVSAQDYPDTLWIPVTFYDYLSNPPSLNPDFENCNNGLEEGLVKDELNDLKRPVPDTNADLSKYEFYDCHANLIQWYTPGDPISYDSSDYNYETNRWKNDANLVEWDPSAYTHPDPDLNNYDFPAVEPGDSMYVSADFDINDPMACVVIYDSLPFLHRGEGVYEFIRNDDDQFFWLDNRGFGDEGREHNYSFAMELHTTFIKSPGLTFSFLGDDDVWAFVDNELAMDLGGVHAQKDGSFNVDDLGLEDWNEYQFDFFYAERHT